MTDLPDSLHCLFSARLDRRGDAYVFEVPAHEIEHGSLAVGDVCRVGVHEQPTTDESSATDAVTQSDADSPSQATAPSHRQRRSPKAKSPPVQAGEQRVVTVEGVGEKGDGIAKTDRGYVLIVPDTKPGEQVKVEVTKVTENVGFTTVIAR